MSNRAAEIQVLHEEYQRLTGLRVALFGREWVWWEWQKRELTVEDLRMLITNQRRRIRLGECGERSLSFRSLIGNVDFAEEEILHLRAQRRNTRQAHPAAEVLRATGRPSAQPVPPSRSTAEIVNKVQSDPAAAAAALAELQKLKNSL